MAKRTMTPLEKFSGEADAMGKSYGKYMEYLYMQECREKREKEASRRGKDRKTH